LDIKISLDGGADKSNLHNDDNFVIAISNNRNILGFGDSNGGVYVKNI
jgi:hypothetical protein